MATRAKQLFDKITGRFDGKQHVASAEGAPPGKTGVQPVVLPALEPELALDEVTINVAPEHLLVVCQFLHDDPDFQFTQMVDLCGIDYSTYGIDEWETKTLGGGSFSRGVEPASIGHLTFAQPASLPDTGKPRFAAIYHLLSITHNTRLRVRCHAPDDDFPVVPSVTSVWACANWYEREAFDLFGILFDGHEDLRRILTDYGFIGHPFRKDFPLIGNVEMRFDPEKGRVVYEPVTIEPRVLVPRVIRSDSRYVHPDIESAAGDTAES